MTEGRCVWCGEPTEGTLQARVGDIWVRLCKSCTTRAAKALKKQVDRRLPRLTKWTRLLAARNKT